MCLLPISSLMNVLLSQVDKYTRHPDIIVSFHSSLLCKITYLRLSELKEKYLQNTRLMKDLCTLILVDIPNILIEEVHNSLTSNLFLPTPDLILEDSPPLHIPGTKSHK